MTAIVAETQIGPARAVIAYSLWPVFIVGATLVVWHSVGPTGNIGAAFLSAAVLVTLLVALERWIPKRKSWDALTDSQVINDAAHGVVQNEIGTRLGELVLLAVLSARGGDSVGTSSLWPHGLPFPAQALLAIFIADGLEYWRHRMLHQVSWLWPIHALHHSAGRMHVLKGGRLHAFDLLSRYLVVFAPLLALGVPRPVVLWYAAALLIIGPISHANLALRFPAWLHRIVVTPPEHHLHHARDLSVAASNYAPVFPVWDILFGTFHHPDEHTLGEVGIEHDPIPAGFFRQCLAPLVWSRLVQIRDSSERGRSRPLGARDPVDATRADVDA